MGYSITIRLTTQSDLDRFMELLSMANLNQAAIVSEVTENELVGPEQSTPVYAPTITRNEAVFDPAEVSGAWKDVDDKSFDRESNERNYVWE